MSTLLSIVQAGSTLGSKSEKLTDLSDETLLQRQFDLRAERMGMNDSTDSNVRASLTNRVKRLEKELRTRGLDFEPLPQANRPMALADMSDEELEQEFFRLQEEYPTLTSTGLMSRNTTRRKQIYAEAQERISKQVEEPVEAPVIEPEPEPTPTDEELVAVTADTETKPKATSRRRRS